MEGSDLAVQTRLPGHVLCPRGKNYRTNYELLEGGDIYRHPMPKEGNSPIGYVKEYGVALFWEFLYAWWIFLRRGFEVIQGCNPPDEYSWLHGRSSCSG